MWDDATQTWSLSKGNGLQVITRKEENIGGNRVITETIKDGSDIIASQVRTTYADITYNSQTSEEIIKIVEDPDGVALTTTRDWYQDPCDSGSCGNLASQINPDGSWVKYEYDSPGRKIVEIRSWLDAPSTASAGSARAIYYDYAAQHVDDSQAAEDARLPRKITEEILDQIPADQLEQRVLHDATSVFRPAGSSSAFFMTPPPWKAQDAGWPGAGPPSLPREPPSGRSARRGTSSS